MRIVWSVLAFIALYNIHQIAGLLGIAPSNVLSMSNDYGEVWTFVVDKARVGTADLQRIGINVGVAQLALVALWDVYRAYGIAFAVWFIIQAVQIVSTCNYTVAEHIDWIILAVFLGTAYLWNRWGPKMRMVWNKYFDLA